MTTFVGRYDRQLDPKGRLALPASIRQKFESQAFLTIGENGCLEAYTPEDHDQMAQDLRDKERRREVDRNFVRTKSAKTFEVPIDAQGRVLIDSTLREYAGLELGSRVAVIGVYDRVEIWNAERFDAIAARSSAEWAVTGPTAGRADAEPPTAPGEPDRPSPHTTHTQREGGTRTRRARGTDSAFAHPEPPGRQDGKPQLRPLPSRQPGETSRRQLPTGGLPMSEPAGSHPVTRA